MISTILGSSATTTSSKTGRTDKADPDAFTKELDRAAGEKGNKEEAGKVISDDKQVRRDDRKEPQQKAESDRIQTEEQKLQQKHLSKLNSYLYELAYKNPDTLSLAEKQSMRMEEFSSVGFHDLRAMLRERGLCLRDFSFTQLAQLTRDGSRNQVASTLEFFMRERDERKPSDLPGPVDPTQMQRDLARELRSVSLQEARQQHQAAEVQHQRQVVIDQILQHIEVRNLANRTELSLKLNPEYLGDLRIKLVHGDQGIKAEFETTSRTTRAVLEESEEDL
ncbi:MAG: hypothetical protein AB1758_23185, partial [Candidatus Eremiobacterota bacterium]